MLQTAVARGTMLGLDLMSKERGGRGGVIVNIASILGLQEMAGCPVYVATKHAVVGLSRSYGVRSHTRMPFILSTSWMPVLHTVYLYF